MSGQMTGRARELAFPWVGAVPAALCAILLSASASRAAENLLRNGDFERDAGAGPDGWSGGRGVSLARREGRGGSACLKCALEVPAYAMASQEITLAPGVPILRVSGWARFRGVVRGDRSWKVARVHLTFHDRGGKRIGGWPIVGQWTGASEWTRFETDFQVPGDAATVRVFAGLQGCSGTVWFDDMSVLPVTPPPPRPGLFPFYVPWDDASGGITNVSHLNEKPAGRHGHVRVRDGRFVDGSGKRIRFLGTNLCFDSAFPTHEAAEGVAARLARFGINVVRFHHMDSAYAPRGIWDGKHGDHRHIDAGQLDRLDYLIARLKEHGVYSNLNLHVSRKLDETDGGIPLADRLPKYDKGVDNFWPRMIELQKEYARDLLTHVNPYTGNPYTDEPALAFVEISNEDSLISFLRGWGGIDSLPAPYQEHLDRRWNEWLARKYGTTEKLRRAWAIGGEPLGAAELLRNAAFASGKEGWWLNAGKPSEAGFDVVPDAFEGLPAAQVTVSRGSDVSWHIQFMQRGIGFEKDVTYTLSFSAKADAPRDVRVNTFTTKAPWHPLGLNTGARLGTEWKRLTFGFKAAEDYSGGRITIDGLARATGTVWLAGFSLRTGGVTGLPEGESLEGRTVLRTPLGGSGQLRSDAAMRDVACFYLDLEKDYWGEMYGCLKRDLGVKSLVTGTQVTYSPVTTQTMMDYHDAHAYWQHPRFPGVPWDSSNWWVGNVSMLNDPQGSTIARLAHARIAGKPYTVSEYNHPAPNTYSSEAYILLAAYAAFQDWDGVYQFSYGKIGEDYENRMLSYFELHSHTHKLVTFPAAAMLFRRGDLSTAKERVTVPFCLDDAIATVLRGGTGLYAHAKGLPRPAAMERGVAIAYPSEGKSSRVAAGGETLRSDTGEIALDASVPGKAVLTVDAARSKAVVGFSSGKRFDLGGVAVAPGENLQNWSAITLTVMDGHDFSRAKAILITATGYVQNKGWSWRDLGKNRVTLGPNWGRGPILVEGIPAEIELPCRARRVQVYALDERGQRRGELKVRRAGGRWHFRTGPEHRTLWYEVVAK